VPTAASSIDGVSPSTSARMSFFPLLGKGTQARVLLRHACTQAHADDGQRHGFEVPDDRDEGESRRSRERRVRSRPLWPAACRRAAMHPGRTGPTRPRRGLLRSRRRSPLPLAQPEADQDSAARGQEDGDERAEPAGRERRPRTARRARRPGPPPGRSSTSYPRGQSRKCRSAAGR
jgi:hypothetical protein